MIGISHDDVVENLDFKKLACSDEITGDFDVRLRWIRIAARMIVANYDCSGACHNCQSENLPGMTEDRIHRSNGHQLVPFDAPTCVEDKHY